MRIYVLDATYPNELEDDESIAVAAKYAAQVRADASAIEGFSDFEEVDLHPGYSLPGFLIEFGWAVGAVGGLVALFMSGKSIRENFDAWKDIGSGVVGAIGRLKKSKHVTMVNSETAGAIAVNEVLSRVSQPKSIALLQHTRVTRLTGVIESQVLFPVPDGEADAAKIDKNYDGYLAESSYNIFVIEIDGIKTMVVGVRTDGTVAFSETMSPLARS